MIKETKEGIAEGIYNKLGLKTKIEAERVVKGVFDVIKNTMEIGTDVAISGFGVFRVVESKERQGRNPMTGEAVTIPAGKKVKFRASKALKDAVK
jgi:DNA-binding protein HU-beta